MIWTYLAYLILISGAFLLAFIIIDVINDTVAFAKKKILRRRKKLIKERIEKIVDKEFEKQGYIRIEI
jgi:hypothetical protein